jgi:IclR family acetate operon transcriptional repressor
MRPEQGCLFHSKMMRNRPASRAQSITLEEKRMLKAVERAELPKLDLASSRNKLVRKAFAVLQAFRGPEEWLTSMELSQRARLPKASGHRLVQTLEEIGAIVRGPSGRYRLGMLVVTLSHKVSIGELLRDAAQPILSEIAVKLGCTTHLGILENCMVRYLCKINGSADFVVHTRVDAQHEAYCSGLGKVLLGSLSPAALDEFLLDGDFVPLTSHTVTDRVQLRNVVQETRLQGYAVDDEESAYGMRCVAVPVRDADDATVAAISVSDRADRLTCDRVGTVRDILREACVEIERRFNPR